MIVNVISSRVIVHSALVGIDYLIWQADSTARQYSAVALPRLQDKSDSGGIVIA